MTFDDVANSKKPLTSKVVKEACVSSAAHDVASLKQKLQIEIQALLSCECISTAVKDALVSLDLDELEKRSITVK